MIVPFILNYCENYDDRPVNILEIGIDSGQTMVPIVHGLITSEHEFYYDAIDIVLKDSLDTILRTMRRDQQSQVISFIKRNSLSMLPVMAMNEYKPMGRQSWGPYDIILLDGDHNYVTVKNELEWLARLSHADTMFVLDDYNTRHSNTDQYYDDRPEYVDHDTTPRADLASPDGKSGVKAAIDDFVAENPDWCLFHLGMDDDPCDFVLMFHRSHVVYDQLLVPGFTDGVVSLCKNETALSHYNLYATEGIE